MVDVMPRLPTPIPFLLAALILSPVEAGAQTAMPSAEAGAAAPSGTAETAGAVPPETEPAVLTLKERLGAKWKDEQRVDNCKVAPERRGSKLRPDRCDDASPK
jgi:hypothetical protein